MDVQLPVIRRGKQQLFAGVKVVPPGKVITPSTLGKQSRKQLIHRQKDERNSTTELATRFHQSGLATTA